MKPASTHHATFVIERHYPATPARVFKAWSDPAAKARWFSADGDWKSSGHRLDFRIGGHEHLRSTAPDGVYHIYDAHYLDLVPDQRIVYAYTMHLGETRISVSLTTVEISTAAGGTRLVFTEQGAFLDGYDNVAQREAGTHELLNSLGRSLPD
ncbi:MAG: putative glutathione S-transferase-related transrane protein [Nevskia sp.]|nr:putative glutathione S-transferase-related transrane protein [Nevskia sp.]